MINKDKIKEAVDYVFNQESKGHRVTVAYRGCISAPGMLVPWDKFCDNPDCTSCQNAMKAIDEALEEEIKKLDL